MAKVSTTPTTPCPSLQLGKKLTPLFFPSAGPNSFFYIESSWPRNLSLYKLYRKKGYHQQKEEEEQTRKQNCDKDNTTTTTAAASPPPPTTTT